MIKNMKYPERLSSDYRFEQYKKMKLEDMDAEEICDRYIAMGSIEELNTPEIQRAIIKAGYVDMLIDTVNIITNKQTIRDIFASNLFEDQSIKFMQGRIENITSAVESENPSNSKDKLYCTFLSFTEKNTLNKNELKRTFICNSRRNRRI